MLSSDRLPGMGEGAGVGIHKPEVDIRRGKQLPDGPHILIGVTSPQTCVVLADRVRALRRAGFRVSILSGPGELLTQTALLAGVESYAIPMERGISPVADCLALVRICRLMRRLRPDLVEFSTPKAGLLGTVAAWLCGIPARIYLLRGLRLETATGVKRRLLVAAERCAARCAHVVICNSRSLRARAEEYRIAREHKLVVLGEGSSNGVDVRHFRPAASNIRDQLGIPQSAPVIGFVGRLTGDKGVPELLEAFRRLLRQHTSAYLLLVGWFDAAEDCLARGVRERIESHPRVIQTGFVPDTAPFYRAMDVLVLPSWREGFPNVLLEAAASGVPTVATNCTGSRDAVLSGVTGLLVEPGNPDAICDAVAGLLGDADLLRRMARAARAWVAENYDHRRVLGLTATFYANLVRAATDRAMPEPELIGDRATDLSVSR